MKRNTKLALGFIAATAIGSTIALPALAHGSDASQGHDGQQSAATMGSGNNGAMMGGKGMMQMMQKMMRMHSKMMGKGMGNQGAMAGGGNNGAMMGGKGMMQMMQKMQKMMGKGMGNQGVVGSMLGKFDANGDGTVTADEARAGLAAMLKKYDTDGNGSLSLSEYEALYSAAIREKMVDQFQALDNDGDGQITGAEMAAPADRIERMQARRSKMQGSASGNAPAGGQNGMTTGTGNGSMMKNN